jgi:hypothetical protein
MAAMNVKLGRQIPIRYCNVLEGSIQMELYCNSETQHTAVKHNQQLFEH